MFRTASKTKQITAMKFFLKICPTSMQNISNEELCGVLVLEFSWHHITNKVAVPRFNSYIIKNSLSYRGVILWNIVSSYNCSNFKTFYSKVRKDTRAKDLSLHTHQHSLKRETVMIDFIIKFHSPVYCNNYIFDHFL